MIINRIRFHNYRVYYGEVVFDFPISGTQNVSIIFANNDVGKTSFFRGILFCLYGTKDDAALSDLINVNAQFEKDFCAAVSIFAEHEGNEIEITRSVELRGKVTGTPKKTDYKTSLTVFKNGVPITTQEDEKMDFINSLIHQDAAQYFFFDGEKINDYSLAGSGKDATKYKDAIARILGIKEIDNAIEDLRILQNDYEKNRDSWIKKQGQYEEILQKKDAISRKVSDEISLIAQYDDEIAAADARIRSFEDRLKDFEENQGRIEKKRKIESQIKKAMADRDRCEDERNTCVQKNATCILGTIAYERISQTEEFEPEDYNISSSVKEHLLHLISQSQCVCGERMDEQRVEAIKRYIEDNFVTEDSLYLKNERKRLFNAIRQYCSHGNESRKRIEDLNLQILEFEQEIAQLNLEFVRLKREIGSFSEDVSEQLAQDINRTEKKRDECLIRKGQAEERCEQARQTLSELESKLAQLSYSNEEGTILQNTLDLTGNLIELFSEYKAKLLEAKRCEVEQNATAVFRSITNAPKKYKGIKITKDYSLQLELCNGQIYQIEQGRALNPSTGQSKVISLSYISGLNKSSEFAAPIIIDNPLGLFSEEHRKAIAEYLPKLGKQIIFMVSTGDLTDTYRDILKPYVKTEYYLENQTTDTWAKTKIVLREDF